MGARKFLIANSYLIGTVFVVFGFVWMVVAAIIGGLFIQIVIAFTITILGPVFWWLGYNNYNHTSEVRLVIQSVRTLKKRERDLHLENE